LHSLQDTEAMRSALNSEHAISPIQSEAYLGVALQDWLNREHGTKGAKRPFLKLADALIRNHGDTWFADFLAAETSPSANQLLQSSIVANYTGDPQQGEREAKLARKTFLLARNRSGAARSEYELIYALKRQSRAKECIQEIPVLSRLLRDKKYHWLEIQLQLETSNCKGMAADLDSAWRAATKAADTARMRAGFTPRGEATSRGFIRSGTVPSPRIAAINSMPT
jgi:hypothetical protein